MKFRAHTLKRFFLDRQVKYSIVLINGRHLFFEKIDHFVFHVLLSPQQHSGLFLKRSEMITLPAKGNDATVIVETEHRLEQKDASIFAQITTVRPIAPLNFHNDSG